MDCRNPCLKTGICLLSGIRIFHSLSLDRSICIICVIECKRQRFANCQRTDCTEKYAKNAFN